MLEKVLNFSIQHRFLVLLFTIGVGVFGVFSLLRVPIDAVPDITNNQVQINTVLASLSPVEIEKQVTFPIETSLAGIPGLQYTRSLSRNGFSQVTAVFEDSVDIYFARTQVNERLGQSKEALPPGADPRMGAITTGLGEIYMYTVAFEHPNGKGATIQDGKLGWQSDGSYLTAEGEKLVTPVEKAAYLRTIQDWIIRPQLKGVKGVAGVDAIGGYVKEYHIEPLPSKLVGFKLTFGEVIDALEKNNVSTGAGYIEHKGESYLVRASGRIETIDEIKRIVVRSHNGIPIYLEDIATVKIGRELRTGSASENGEDAVVSTALMLIGANSRTVAAAVDDKMKEIKKSLPPDITAKTVLNRTKLVNATIKTVEKNLVEGAILVIVILFFMLGNIRAALITATAIPLSMLITSIGMVEANISGNLMSLGAVDFGLIVDGAVIIVENCLRRLAEKQHEVGRTLTLEERLEEVTIAAKEMIQPSVYGQAIIVTVYVPILALTGVEGKMFHPMAMTVIFALVGAFVLSLTFIPAMVALLITGKVQEKDNVLVAGIKKFYEPVVKKAVRNRAVVVLGAVVIFVISIFLFRSLGDEFIPTLDEKDIAMQAIRIPSTGITQSSAMQIEIERVISKLPEVAFIFSKTGTAEMASDPMPPNASDTFLILKPKDEWPNPAKDKALLVKEIQQALKGLPGNNYEFTQPIQMRFNELISGVRSDVAVKVYGDNFDQMQVSAEAIASALRQVKGSAEVKVEQTQGLPVMSIDIKREALARFGLTVSEVQDVIAAAIGGRDAGLVFQGDRRFKLVVRLPEEIRESLTSIQNLPILIAQRDLNEGQGSVSAVSLNENSSKFRFVPLSALANINVVEGPNQISRENGKRRIVVQSNVRERDLGSFVSEAQAAVDKVALPPGGWIEWGGQFENLVAARKTLAIVVPGCFLVIFILLYSTFNSAKYALLVFSGVPLGLTGGILALWLRGIPFSISAAVGFIALSGVAVLNGLVMVSFINHLREAGKTIEQAIFEGALTRLRPVLMTALVASFGFVPMALATGTGAEVQRPLATVVIGGIISSTLLTLLVLPALYSIFNRSPELTEGGYENEIR